MKASNPKDALAGVMPDDPLASIAQFEKLICRRVDYIGK